MPDMVDDDIRDLFPGREVRKMELVVLVEHDGEHMYQRESDGTWRRLQGEPA